MEKLKDWTAYEERSGIVPIDGADPEKVKKARLLNLIEPIIVYSLILTIVWVTGLDESPFMWISFGLILIWILIISPIWHFKSEKELFLKPEERNIWFWLFECRGLGSIRKYFLKTDGKEPNIKKQKKNILSLLTIFAILFIYTLLRYNTEFGDYLNIWFPDYPKHTDYPTAELFVFVGLFLVICTIPILALILFPVMIRFDTLKNSSKQILFTLAIGVPLILLFNFIFQIFPELPWIFNQVPNNPVSAADQLDEFIPLYFMAQFSGYIFWGFIQQLLFLSVFSVQFSRAFDVKTKNGQIYAALCSSLFFGLIHLPQFWLSLFTWISGFIWSIIFLKSRNLFMMGISHGALATLLNQLTPIPFSVGPKSIL
ncbi:MAG: CPBP family intramembrane metalloprotease [archaeon]|nr:CPBP family intramembrane metalloprotease [archaeon]